MTDYWRAAPGEAFAEAGALHLRSHGTDQWLVLRGSALAIWDAVEYPATVGTIAARLAAHFAGDAARIDTDIRAMLAMLLEHGLVEHGITPGDDRRQRYLALLKRGVTNSLYPELELQIDALEAGDVPAARLDRQRFKRDIAVQRPEAMARLLATKRDGRGQGRYAHTISGMLRLNHLERCAETIFAERVAGDFIEAGTCRGGAAILLRALQVAHGEAGRCTWVADSFAGVPPPQSAADRHYAIGLEEEHAPWLACDLPGVRAHFARYDLLDDGVRFVPGLIADSLPGAGIGALALVRLDLDLHSATAQALDLLYDRVSPGGFVVIDDYRYLPGCAAAVDEFRAARCITDPISHVDRIGSYWRKGVTA